MSQLEFIQTCLTKCPTLPPEQLHNVNNLKHDYKYLDGL